MTDKCPHQSCHTTKNVDLKIASIVGRGKRIKETRFAHWIVSKSAKSVTVLINTNENAKKESRKNRSEKVPESKPRQRTSQSEKTTIDHGSDADWSELLGYVGPQNPGGANMILGWYITSLGEGPRRSSRSAPVHSGRSEFLRPN
jgi:hypothetical protein